MSRIAIGCLAFTLALSLGCRDESTPSGQQDATVNPHSDGGVQTDSATGGDGGGSTQTFDSIKALRQASLTMQAPIIVSSAVVTAVTGNYKTAYIEDADGGAKSGIALFCNPTASSSPCALLDTIKTLKPGNKVKITGTFDVYNGKEEIKPTAIEVLDPTEGPLPAYVDLTPAQAADNLTASDYEGVLVNITGVSSSTPLTVKSTTPAAFKNTSASTTDCSKGPQYSAFEVWDNTSTIAVTTSFYRGLDIASDANCIIWFDAGVPSDHLVVVGDKFNKLAGVLDLDPYAQLMALNPARAADYEYAPAGDHDGGM
jgi:DNA/RNA endonuclease YhcR with UshA esterase domain